MKSKTQKFFKGQHGISLVALIVTIIVMVILAGIIITAAVADGGVIDRAEEAVVEKGRAEVEDIVKTSYVFEKVATTENSSVGLDLKATAIAIYNNLTRAGFELIRTSDIVTDNGTEKGAVLKGTNDKPTGIDVFVKGDNDEVTYTGTLDKYGLVGKIITIPGGEIPPPPPPSPTEYDIEMNLSSGGNGKYNQINVTYFYPQSDSDIKNSYEYMVEKGNSKELILEQVNFLFEAEAKVRKTVKNMIENYELQQYIDNPDLIDEKLPIDETTKENEFENQCAKLAVLFIKELYQNKNEASETAVTNNEQRTKISEVYFDGDSPRQFATLEDAIDYLKKEDRVETILRHDFVVNLLAGQGDIESLDNMNAMIDDETDEMDFAAFFEDLEKGENTTKSIYEAICDLNTENKDYIEKDTDALCAAAVLAELVPDIQESNIFEMFDKDNAELKDSLGNRTIFELTSEIVEALSEKNDHTQLENDINGIYDILGRWENSKGFAVADQMINAVVGDYKNYKVEFLDETGNKIGDDYYDYFYYSTSVDGERDEYIYMNSSVNLQKASADGQSTEYFDGADKVTVNLYNGDELIQSTTKTLEEFKQTN